MSNTPKFRRRFGLGIDAFNVANLTGTFVAMIEKNYGHLNKDAVKAKLDRMAI
jgi:hypothetical protein